MLVSSAKLIQLYGDPTVATQDWEHKNMTYYRVPGFIKEKNPFLPNVIYMPVSYTHLTLPTNREV